MLFVISLESIELRLGRRRVLTVRPSWILKVCVSIIRSIKRFVECSRGKVFGMSDVLFANAIHLAICSSVWYGYQGFKCYSTTFVMYSLYLSFLWDFSNLLKFLFSLFQYQPLKQKHSLILMWLVRFKGSNILVNLSMNSKCRGRFYHS